MNIKNMVRDTLTPEVTIGSMSSLNENGPTSFITIPPPIITTFMMGVEI